MPSASILLPILWVAIGVGWAPLLLSERVRRLLERGPASHLAVNYAIAVVVVGLVHAGLFFAAALSLPQHGVNLLLYAFASNVAVPLLWWVAVVGIVPALRDVPEAREAALPLTLGAVWYAVVTTGLLFVLFLVLLAVGLPF